MSDNSAMASNLTDNMTRQHEEAIAQLRADSINRTTSLNSMKSDITNLQNSMTTLTQMIHDLAVITFPPPHSQNNNPTTLSFAPTHTTNLLNFTKFNPTFNAVAVTPITLPPHIYNTRSHPKPIPASSPTFHQTPSAPSLMFHRTTSTQPTLSSSFFQSTGTGSASSTLTPATAASSAAPSFPLVRNTPDSTQSALHLNNTSSPSSALSLSTTPRSPLSSLFHPNFTLPPPRSLIEKLTLDLARSNLMSYGSKTQSGYFYDLDTNNIDFGLNNLEQRFDFGCKIGWPTFSSVFFHGRDDVKWCSFSQVNLMGMETLAASRDGKWIAVKRSTKDKALLIVFIHSIHLMSLHSSLDPAKSSLRIKTLRKTILFIFDPGGKIKLESLFVAWFVHRDTQLYHNSDITTSTSKAPTYDLEDKVGFEGSVMIRISHPLAQGPADSKTRDFWKLLSIIISMLFLCHFVHCCRIGYLLFHFSEVSPNEWSCFFFSDII